MRAQNSLHMMGAAVLNGGITTFLAVILLSDSTSHGLITFFKVFFLTVLFGLFHAVVFLPVVLSFIPQSVCGCLRKRKIPPHENTKAIRKSFEETEGMDANVPKPNHTDATNISSSNTFIVT